MNYLYIGFFIAFKGFTEGIVNVLDLLVLNTRIYLLLSRFLHYQPSPFDRKEEQLRIPVFYLIPDWC